MPLPASFALLRSRPRLLIAGGVVLLALLAFLLIPRLLGPKVVVITAENG